MIGRCPLDTNAIIALYQRFKLPPTTRDVFGCLWSGEGLHSCRGDCRPPGRSLAASGRRPGEGVGEQGGQHDEKGAKV
jgi:hypothetical protein